MLSARGTAFTKQHAIGTVVVVTCLLYVAYRYRENPPVSGPGALNDASVKAKSDGAAVPATAAAAAPAAKLDCRNDFCVWDRSKRAFVEFSHKEIPTGGDMKRHARRAAISARLRKAGPDSITRLPPRPASARAIGPIDTFPARDRRALQITKEHFESGSVQGMFKRAAASDTDNSLWTISDEVYSNHNEKASPHYEQGGDLPQVWNTYRPLWTCLGLDRVGEVMDGGKWLCDPSGFPKASPLDDAQTTEEKECVVYSFGSNLQFDFETAIHRYAPHCEIHIFDPTVTPSQDPNRPVPDYVTYHYVGLGSKSNPSGKGQVVAGLGLVESLGDAMIRLGHTHIDLLKVDIEGHEWAWMATLESGILTRVDEFLIELHFHGTSKLKKLFDKLFAADFRIFHNEPNLFPGPTQRFGIEYSLVRVVSPTNPAGAGGAAATSKSVAAKK